MIDGAGAPLRDALIEIWQANAAGRYNHPADTQDKPLDEGFRGWGRAVIRFRHRPLVRSRPSSPAGCRAGAGTGRWRPHVNLWIVARGINIGLNTRMYFADEAEANADDPVLRLIEPEERRKTLIAPRATRDGQAVYRFDIHLQGDKETVFFDV